MSKVLKNHVYYTRHHKNVLKKLIPAIYAWKVVYKKGTRTETVYLQHPETFKWVCLGGVDSVIELISHYGISAFRNNIEVASY